MAEKHFKLPPALEVREVRVITQTITRAFTTITTLVTLGDPTAVIDIARPTKEPPPPPPAAAPAATLPPAPSSGTLSPGQLGALLGSVLGFAFLVLVICCCLSCHRRRRREERIIFYGTGSEYSGSESEVTREYYTSTRDWNRIRGPGGLGFANAEGMMGGVGGMPRRTDVGFTMVPPPARFPPTPRYTPYRQSRWPQISGVRRFP